MIKILCYGDSNTWGYNPATQDRYPGNERWPGVLRNNLNDNYLIIEEGLNGRTTVWDDPIEGYKNGKEYLIPCLETHKPLDLIVLFLGTNDLKQRFSLSAYDIANGAGTLAKIIKNSKTGPDEQSPEILLLAPPPVSKLTEFAQMFKGAGEKSLKLGQEYKKVANEHNCQFLDTSNIIKSSNLDGIHFDKENHRKLGKEVAKKIKQFFNK